MEGHLAEAQPSRAAQLADGRASRAASRAQGSREAHLILDVLFSPLRRDVSREMLREFHLDSAAVFLPPAFHGSRDRRGETSGGGGGGCFGRDGAEAFTRQLSSEDYHRAARSKTHRCPFCLDGEPS